MDNKTNYKHYLINIHNIFTNSTLFTETIIDQYSFTLSLFNGAHQKFEILITKFFVSLECYFSLICYIESEFEACISKQYVQYFNTNQSNRNTINFGKTFEELQNEKYISDSGIII
jgi:hypothetical protein